MQNSERMANISVLLPVSAAASRQGLVRAHESVTDQSLPPAEVVLVTNQELPEELDSAVQRLVRTDSRSRRVHASSARGLGEALQAGLEACSEAFVARMDADDVSLPDRFEAEHAVLETTDADVVGSHLAEFRTDVERVERVRRVPTAHEEIAAWMAWRCPLNHPTTMFDRAAVLEAGGYRHFPTMEDWDLWARCLAAGLRFRNLDEVLVRARVEELADRRGGLDYARAEVRMARELRRLGIASDWDTCRHLAVRLPLRLVPARLRDVLYRRVAR